MSHNKNENNERVPTIVFLCTGNTCRSPMAAALAGLLLQEAGEMGIKIHSAGVNTWGGQPASLNAILAMEDENINIREHKSQLLTNVMLSEATLILTMTQNHLLAVLDICPTAKAYTLGEYAGFDGDVTDPFGGDLSTYRACAAQIKHLLMLCMTKIREDLWKH